MIRGLWRWTAAALAAVAAGAVLATCSQPVPQVEPPQPLVSLDALGQVIPSDGARTAVVAAPLGLRLLVDAPRGVELGVTRSILQANHRLGALDALALAEQVRRIAAARGVPYDLFAALILQESAFSRHALSSAGAIGLGQLTAGTAAWLGVEHPFDARDNLEGAADYLALLLHRYRGRPDPFALAAAAYNAGPGAVDAYHGIPPYPETEAYVRLVLFRWGRLLSDADAEGARRR